MTILGKEIAGRVIGLVAALVILVAAAAIIPGCVSKWRSERAQSRVERGQAGAASESAKDAIGTVTDAGKREAGSEELTRSNEREIRAAEGADTRIGPGVDYAGRAALCRREAYRNDPRCKGQAR